jgi:hypothetical protein
MERKQATPLKNGVICYVTPCGRTDVSQELSASIISVTRIGELVKNSPILVTLMMEALSSSETSVLPHGVTSQKTPIFIVTAVKTSNLTSNSLVSNLVLSTKS